jgi:translation initiation factor 1
MSPSRTVWSSEEGDLRKKKNEDTAAAPAPPARRQAVTLHRETKGRAGKGVTLVKGLALSPPDLEALAKRLKQACGSGGTVKAGVIEIQGDQRQRLAVLLQELGFKVKIAGG